MWLFHSYAATIPNTSYVVEQQSPVEQYAESRDDEIQ